MAPDHSSKAGVALQGNSSLTHQKQRGWKAVAREVDALILCSAAIGGLGCIGGDDQPFRALIAGVGVGIDPTDQRVFSKGDRC